MELKSQKIFNWICVHLWAKVVALSLIKTLYIRYGQSKDSSSNSKRDWITILKYTKTCWKTLKGPMRLLKKYYTIYKKNESPIVNWWVNNCWCLMWRNYLVNSGNLLSKCTIFSGSLTNHSTVKYVMLTLISSFPLNEKSSMWEDPSVDNWFRTHSKSLSIFIEIYTNIWIYWWNFWIVVISKEISMKLRLILNTNSLLKSKPMKH